MTLQVLLDQVRLRWRDSVALIEDDLTLSYGELLDLAARAAATAKRLTGKERPSIAAFLGNRWEFVAIDLGCAYAGCTLVRLNARDTAADIAYLLSDSGADCFVFSEDFAAVARDAMSRADLKLPTVELATGRAASRRSVFEAALGSAPAGTPPALEANDPYKIMYTSGTTGMPKGVIVTHDQWICAVIQNLFTGPLQDLREGASILHVMPLTHIAGGMMWPFMLRGARQVISPDTTLDAIADSTARHGISHTFLVPTLVTRLIGADAGQQQALGGLERIYYAGSPIGAESLRRAIEMYGPIFAQGYGSTEAMWWMTYLSPEEHRAALESGRTERLASCGRPSLGVELALVDDEGRPVGPGEMGEVATRGRHVARAYINKGAVPRDERIGPDWFRVGDIGYRDQEGYVHLVDRKSNLIITGGFNVYPGEVETALATCPGVAECCVLGAPDEQWGELITAFVVRGAGVPLTEQQVLDHGRANLADYRRPRRVHFMDELPQNSAGKIDRAALRRQVWGERSRRI